MIDTASPHRGSASRRGRSIPRTAPASCWLRQDARHHRQQRPRQLYRERNRREFIPVRHDGVAPAAKLLSVKVLHATARHEHGSLQRHPLCGEQGRRGPEHERGAHGHASTAGRVLCQPRARHQLRGVQKCRDRLRGRQQRADAGGRAADHGLHRCRHQPHDLHGIDGRHAGAEQLQQHARHRRICIHDRKIHVVPEPVDDGGRREYLGRQHLSRCDGYDYVTQMSGTSMAAPQAAGAAALLASKWPFLVAQGTIPKILEVTAQDMGAAGADATYGDGFLRAGEPWRCSRWVRSMCP